MCLLTFYPEGSMPDTKDLENGAIYNDDGHGFAIVDTVKNRLIVRKSMDADVLIELFEEMRSKHLDGPAIFHSRIGTAGTLTKDNCHPFYIGGTNQMTLIAHNGILPRKAQPDILDDRSDTRLLAEEFLPVGRFGAYHTRAGRKALGRWAGLGNKFAILSVDPRLGGHGFLVNADQGDWENGPTGPIWYSNSSYLPSSWTTRWAGVSYQPKYSWIGGREIGTVVGGSSSSSDEKAGEELPESHLEGTHSHWHKSGKGEWKYSEGFTAGSGFFDKDRECEFCKMHYFYHQMPSVCMTCDACQTCADWAGDCSCVRDAQKEAEYVQWWTAQFGFGQ